MKGGSPPSMVSFARQGRGEARSLQLLERIQERNAERILTRRREAKPPLLRTQMRLVVSNIPIDGDNPKPTPPVEAVRFEGTGKSARRSAPWAAAIAAGLLTIIAPSLGGAEETTRAGVVQIKPDNPFGFVKGKTRIGDIGRLLDEARVGKTEWILEEYRGAGTTLLVADGVKALYWFNKDGVYEGGLLDLNTLEHVDLSKAKNWTITTSNTGRTFITAENLLARGSDGTLKPALLILTRSSDVLQQIEGIVFAEGGFRNPRLRRVGSLVLLYADKEDGTPWMNVYAFSGLTGEPRGIKPADPGFLEQSGLAMLTR